MYVAWENGSGDAHVPACCNYYIHIDMSEIFQGNYASLAKSSSSGTAPGADSKPTNKNKNTIAVSLAEA